MKLPKGYTKSPWKWVKGTKLQPYYRKETAGFYHVTTRVSDVLRDGRLKARRDVDHVGLGGGPDYLVSFTFDLLRAQRLYFAIHSVAQWVEGSIFGNELILRALRWHKLAKPYDGSGYFEGKDISREYISNTIGHILRILGWREHEVDELLDSGVYEETELSDLIAGYGWKDLLKHYQYDYETSEEVWHDLNSIDDSLDNYPICSSTVGFMGELYQVEAWKPEEIGIVQCAIKNTADATLIHKECELRFEPEDILLLGLEYRVN